MKEGRSQGLQSGKAVKKRTPKSRKREGDVNTVKRKPWSSRKSDAHLAQRAGHNAFDDGTAVVV